MSLWLESEGPCLSETQPMRGFALWFVLVRVRTFLLVVRVSATPVPRNLRAFVTRVLTAVVLILGS